MRTTLLIMALALLAACNDEQPATLTIMAFNVENLFDNEDDPHKDDRDYLPIEQKQTAEHRAACAELEVAAWRKRCLTIDWNDEILAKKLAAVAGAILQVNGGKGPDIIALQEVENIGILERLRTEYLQAAGYRPGILIEGRDTRGIDVAFLSRLPVIGSPQLHDIVFSAAAGDRVDDTRGILQADFRLPDGSTLSGFSVHFPAPYHPTEMRIAAYETLNELLAGLPADRPAFAAGDFNTTTAEDSDKHMLDRFARPSWQVSNDYCTGCKGTEYYGVDNSWSFLDMILWHGAARGKNTTHGIRISGVEIANGSGEQQRPDGTPRRFGLPEGNGVSDHWPVVMSLETK
jgi:endonuclease/exonuclease/phosphatase family metal-dependent hydrolase